MILFKSAAPFFIDNKNNYPVIPNRYLDDLQDRGPLTVRAYAYALWQWFDWCEAAGTSWDKATEDHVRHYWRSLPETNENRTNNGRIDRVIAFYKWAAENHRFPNPIRTIIAEGMHRAPEYSYPHLVKADQVGHFINTLPQQWHRLAAQVMLLSGLRRAEAILLPRSVLSIPTDSQIVKIPVLGKGAKLREVNLPVPLRDALAKYCEGNRSFIFEHNRLPYHPDTIGRVFHEHAEKTSIAIHPHLLRHTYAVNRLIYLEKDQAGKGGMNAALIMLQAELGHASLETTQIYLHLVRAYAVPESYSGFMNSMIAKTKVRL
jgi:integrase